MNLSKIVRSAMICAMGLGLTFCSKDDSSSDAPITEGSGSLYMVATSIDTPDGSTAAIMFPSELKDSALDLKSAITIPGGGFGTFSRGSVYLGNYERQEIKRYELVGNTPVERQTLSFAGRGLAYLPEPVFISAERAFVFNDGKLEYIEFNPTTMTITGTHDLSSLKKEGWGAEYRAEFFRESDGKLFFIYSYNNERTSFLDELTVGVFDTNTNGFKILTEASCPTSAGFGGYVDEKNDFYAFADNFGLFTQLNNPSPKKSCVLRIKNGEDAFDPSYKTSPVDALDGKFAWGYYYLGDGLVFTSVIDTATATGDSVYSILFEGKHGGAVIDTKTNSSVNLTDLPASGVGFQPYRVDNNLLVARSSGTTTDGTDVLNALTTVYKITGENGGKSEPLFTLPGFVLKIAKVR